LFSVFFKVILSIMNIRNFVIIAHIDHGKSTLADRFLEITKTIDSRQMKPQYLDRLELERERAITIKMAPVRMSYTLNLKSYILNLIDTPGHSDFSYEVSRALSAVEGAILLVDATCGVQAQTLANFEAARKIGLKIIGAVNKIDVAASEQIENSLKELSGLLETDENEIFKISGKTGEGVEELLRGVIEKLPSPKRPESPTFNQALIFDSLYDEHKGIIAFVRIFNGNFKAGDETKLLGVNKRFKIKEIGYFLPELKKQDILIPGEMGYIATGVKDLASVKVGDTIGERILPGFKTPQPVVFVSLYPEKGDDYENLKTGFYKLRLNDSSFTIFPTSSEAFGHGFQAGFLGKLHFEITVERLEKEFGIKTINSFPSVGYRVKTLKGDWLAVENPRDLPENYVKALEPITAIKIMTPMVKVDDVLKLKKFFRLDKIRVEINGEKAIVSAELPLADLISDFDDKLKSVASGFASFSYEIIEERATHIKKLDIRIANSPVYALSRIVQEKDVQVIARQMVEKLKELLPQKQFSQAIQAVCDNRILARETIPALRKDVAGYLYGGDRTRKMKLWQKQKKGKKKLLERATDIEIPVKIFKDLLK